MGPAILLVPIAGVALWGIVAALAKKKPTTPKKPVVIPPAGIQEASNILDNIPQPLGIAGAALYKYLKANPADRGSPMFSTLVGAYQKALNADPLALSLGIFDAQGANKIQPPIRSDGVYDVVTAKALSYGTLDYVAP